MKSILIAILSLLVATSTARGAGPIEQPIVLHESLGYAWPEDVIHQHVELAKKAGLFADRVRLFRVKQFARTRVPMQLANIRTYPDGSRPEGYGQGTPNQKHCAFSCRAMAACILANHPLKKQWLEFAMAELRPHYQMTIAESGALLESPFYSSRDTMRDAPFWPAMTRATATIRSTWSCATTSAGPARRACSIGGS